MIASVVEQALIEWEETLEQGTDVDIETFSAKFSEHADEIVDRAKKLALVDAMLGLTPDYEIPSLSEFDSLELIGQGGMGLVFKAREKSLSRIVAIKTPKRSCYSRSTNQRFEKEAQLLAELRHPNIVTIFQARLIDERPFFVMDFMEGGSLADKMQDYQDLDKACLAIEQIAGAVHYAHEKGILHRDLKPANILLDEAGILKVADFGIATQLSQGQGRPDFAWLHSSQMMGTRAYVAPEQQVGKRVDRRADIWALGVLFHEMVWQGKPNPSGNSNPSGKSSDGLVESKYRSSKPSLQLILQRCLAVNPDDRFVTAEELANEVKRLRESLVPVNRFRWTPVYTAICFMVVFLSCWAWLGNFFQSGKISSPAQTALQEETASSAQQGPKSPSPILVIDKVNPDALNVIKNALNGGQNSTLIDSDGNALTYRAKSLVPFKIENAEQGAFRVHCTGECFVELLDTVPIGEYIIRCEIKEGVSLAELSRVGIFLGLQEKQNFPLENYQHYTGVLFSDKRDKTTARDDSEVRMAMSFANGSHYLRKRMDQFRYEPKEWHQISISITKEGVGIQFDDIDRDPISFDKFQESNRLTAKKLGLTEQDFLTEIFPHLSVGLLVDGSEASLRNFQIIPFQRTQEVVKND